MNRSKRAKTSNNNTENEISWSNIFQKVLTLDYFSNHELVLLSTLNKNVRSAVKHLIFSHLFISGACKQLVNNGGANLENLTHLLNTEIQPISQTITKVTISYKLPFTDMNPLFNHLLHIKHIVFESLELDIFSFNRLMARLMCLESLTLEWVTVWIPGYASEEEEFIKLPPSIKKLRLNGQKYMAMDIDPNNPDFINYTGNKELYNHFDLFNYEDFHPNLQIVKLEDAPFNHDIPLPVDIILTNNPKLTNLMGNMTDATPINFERISTSNIGELTLQSWRANGFNYRDFADFSSLQLNSIHTINIKLHYTKTSHWRHLTKLAVHFPQVKTLQLELSGLTAPLLEQLLGNFPQLTNLMLNVTLKGKKQNTLHITNNSVTHLIISACNMMDLDLDLFMKWIALKRITIWNSACKGVHMNDIESKINQHGSWKCIVYEYSKSERTVKLFKV